MDIRKRDGSIHTFKRNKIVNAILNAVKEVKPYTDLENCEFPTKIADKIEEYCRNRQELVTVEEIQDLVENFLIKYNELDVAKSYIKYRYLHKLARNKYNDMMNIISEKISGTNVQNQNANVDEASFGGRVGEASDATMKNYALEFCVSKMAKNNHLNNEIYIHDLSSYPVGSHNCISIPFDDLLKNGFNTRQTSVRPANSINTAFQLLAVIFQLQSLQQFGGCSATHVDWTMVPYVRKSYYKHLKDGLKYMGKSEDYKLFETYFKDIMSDSSVEYINSKWNEYFNDFNISDEIYKYAVDMTEKETRQAVEGMFHNLNTLQSRSGNQLPFTSLNFGTCTSPEGRLIIKCILDVCYEGIGKLHRTSIFPCLIFQSGEGINRKQGDPNYDLFQLALKCTAKRLYPNYANIDWSGNEGYDPDNPSTYFATMGLVA